MAQIKCRQAPNSNFYFNQNKNSSKTIYAIMTLKPWKIISSNYLVKDQWLTLRADKCETKDGLTIDPFYVLEANDWVHVVGFNENQQMLLVKQYRHGVCKIGTEIPTGVMDDTDNTPLDGAKRELLEETGCEAEDFVYLGSMHANPARQTNRVHTFLAKGVKQIAEQKLDETEDIEFGFFDIESVMELIDQGEFTQSLHIASIFLTLRYCGLLEKAYQKASQNHS